MNAFLSTLKERASETQNGRAKDEPQAGKQYNLSGIAAGKTWAKSEVGNDPVGTPDKEELVAMLDDSTPTPYLTKDPDAGSDYIICRLGVTNGGSEAVEIVFSGPINKDCAAKLKGHFFGYVPSLKCWRAKAIADTVQFAKSLATIDEIGVWPIGDTEPAKIEPDSDVLTEYKESLEVLAQCWNCDITDAMIKAVNKCARELS